MARAKKKDPSGNHSRQTETRNNNLTDSVSMKPLKQKDKNVSINTHYVLFFLMLFVFAGCFTLIRPYIHTILLALILAFVMKPVHERIENGLGGRKNTAAAMSCLLLTTVVVLPLFFMLFSLISQAVSSFNSMSEFIATGKAEALLSHPLAVKMTDILRHIMPDIKRAFPDLANIKFDKLIMNTSASLGKNLLNQSGHIVGNIGSLIASFFLMIFTFFFIVRDEDRLLDKLLHLVPLTDSQERQIITKIKEVAKSALLGTFVTALAQGFAGGLAFFICGLPGLFWGMVMAFASLIPMVGTALIWGPACLYLLFSGSPWLAIFLLIWCVVVVGGIDNFVRPLFMKGGSDMHTLLIFFSILGGINTFGLMGLLYGPLLFGLAIVLLYIYSTEFKDFLTGQDDR
jgi:predicted PurR-regulated permease PerM